jgi:hypothetical protein
MYAQIIMPINLGFILNIIDDLKEHLRNQDYITCMNILRDANKVIQKHEEKLSNLWSDYYELRDGNDFYTLFVEFISTQMISFPRSFDRDRHHLALADDYLHDLDDSDENHERIDDAVVVHLNNLKRIKRKYETFICTDHPELIDAAAIYIMKRSGYDDFDFCGRHFDMNTFDPTVWEEE